MATVCSAWAPREPSTLRSSSRPGRCRSRRCVCRNHGSIAITRPGLQREAATGLAVVRDVRVAVHGAPDAVAAELQVDAEAGGARDRADGGGDVAEPVADPGGGDAGLQRLFGRGDQREVLLTRGADDQADSGVRHPAVDADREVEAEQVAVRKRVVVGEPVQHGVVDRRAEHLAEGHRPERRVVVDVARLGPPLLDHPVRHGVEVEQVDPDVGHPGQVRQHLGHELAGGAHLLDLGRRAELDHAPRIGADPAGLRLAAGQGRVSQAGVYAGSATPPAYPTRAEACSPPRWSIAVTGSRPSQASTSPGRNRSSGVTL